MAQSVKYVRPKWAKDGGEVKWKVGADPSSLSYRVTEIFRKTNERGWLCSMGWHKWQALRMEIPKKRQVITGESCLRCMITRRMVKETAREIPSPN